MGVFGKRLSLLSSGYFGEILGDLAESGYDARWIVLSAGEMGAPHLRKRLWILAYSNEIGWNGSWALQENYKRKKSLGFCIWKWNKIDCQSERFIREFMGRDASSEIDRVVDGVAGRLDRLGAIGNGQIPAVARAAWKLLADGIE